MTTAYIVIWPGLQPADLRSYDAPTEATMKYGNLKDPLKKAEKLREAQDDWATDVSLAAKAEYGFVRGIGVRLDGVNSVYMGDHTLEASVLKSALKLAGRASVAYVFTAWTEQFLRFRCLATSQLPYTTPVPLAERYFSIFTSPELRTVGYSLRSSQHEDLLPNNASPVSDDAVTNHLSAALLLLQHLNAL